MEMTEKQKRRIFKGTFETQYSGFDTSGFWIDQSDEFSLTEQHLKNDVDINEIVSRFQKTGYLPSPDSEPQYIDCTEFVDYQDSLDRMNELNDYFKSLPSSLRGRFENNPSNLVDFLADPANRDEAVKLDLLPDLKEPDAPPVKVEVVQLKQAEPSSPLQSPSVDKKEEKQ